MYLIVVGAEVEGRRFIEMALEQGHEVILIETDEKRARQTLEQSRVRLVNQQCHRQMFERLGVKSVSDPAGIIAGYLYEHIA